MQTFKQKLFYKILFAIILVASLALLVSNFSSVFAIASPSETSKTWGTTRENMPQNNTGGSTGMLPQYWPGTSARDINLDGSRLNWMANGQWKATINGSIVYCAHKGWYVRYGYYDPAIHWLIPGQTNIQGVSLDVAGTPVGDMIDTEYNIKYNLYREESRGHTYYINTNTGVERNSVFSFSASKEEHLPGPREAVGYLINDGSETGGAVSKAGALTLAMGHSHQNKLDESI